MTVNITSIKASSNGAWQGDNPLDYALPLLIIQTSLVLLISRSLAFLLKPLRQPKVIAEILGGILLGPSALGRNKAYLDRIFPAWSEPILETVASIGLLFFLFLVSLELDLNSIRRSGRKAFSIAAAGISLPFISGVGVAFILRKTVRGEENVGFAQFVVFMGVALSITAFPVLARILAELKLLTTRVGETAMAAAAFNDVVAWVLLALAVALAGDGPVGGDKKSPLVSVWVLLSGGAFVFLMLVFIRPVMTWVAKQCSTEHQQIDEAYICLTLAAVIISGLTTDLIGIHSIFGAFVFGLTIPKGEFAGRLIERTEDFVSGLLLPLYFASSGLKTDITKIRGLEAWGLLVLVVTTACVGKIFGTFSVALMNKIPAREAMTLGLLMNTKGLVELIVLNIGKEKKVLDDEVFAILVLMAIFPTFITTPTFMAIYKPARGTSLYTHRKLQRELPSPFGSQRKGLRILACVHGPGNVPSLIKLVESTRASKDKSLLKLYVMHFMELTERSSSILMVQRARRNGLPFINRIKKDESLNRVAIAFEAYNQLGQVKVRHVTTISDLLTMHQDVCHVAEEKRVTMIILPFHKKQGRRGPCGGKDGDVGMENVGSGWGAVNQRVLKDAPCTVAVLVDRGLGDCGIGGAGWGQESEQERPTATVITQKVCVVFLGGPDDREALEIGGRMVEHPGIHVSVVQFIERKARMLAVRLLPWILTEKRSELDENAVAEFRKKWHGLATYVEKEASNIVAGVLAIGRSREYELIIVGRGRFTSKTIVDELAAHTAEHAELGLVGSVLASSGHGVLSSVLVIQQYYEVKGIDNDRDDHPVPLIFFDGGEGCSSRKIDASPENTSNIYSSV